MAHVAEETLAYAQLAEENRRLKARLAELERSASSASSSPADAALPDCAPAAAISAVPSSAWSHGLTPAQIDRYSRQLILSDFGGADTQRKLLDARVLIVGAGGLGAPVALYLAAAGVGHLTLVDGDRVELSNLHRQVIHTEARIGQYKAESAAAACRALNSDVAIRAVTDRFTEANAIELAERVDLIVDASDNVATRYLCNDAAIVCGKVLVSGSALRLEGQVSVFGLHGGPCYRCLYPKPPPAETVTNCSDGGVLGAITGIIGSIQALEVIKILGELIAKPMAPMPAALSADSTDYQPARAAATLSTCDTRLLLFDGSSTTFRSVKIRPRSKECVVCGDAPTITKQTLQERAIDYQLFCGSAHHDGPRLPGATAGSKVPSASVEEYQQAVAFGSGDSRPLLIDVREPVQFRICALPNAVNVPLRMLKRGIPDWLNQLLQPSAPSVDMHARSTTAHPSAASAASPAEASTTRQVFVMCRRGVDSVSATRILVEAAARARPAESPAAASSAPAISIRNVSGGLQSWSERIDRTFPLY